MKTKTEAKWRLLEFFMALGFLTIALPAWAANIQYDFATPNANNTFTENSSLGNSFIFFPVTSNTPSVTATGFISGNASPVYTKHEGGSEMGLGLTNETNPSDHEINTHGAVSLSLTNLFNAGFSLTSITLGSVQTNEGFKLYTSSAAGGMTTLLGTFVANGINNDFQGVSGAFNVGLGSFTLSNFLTVVGFGPNDNGHHDDSADVSVWTLGASSVSAPEPTTLLLLGSGIAMAAYRKRKGEG